MINLSPSLIGGREVVVDTGSSGTGVIAQIPSTQHLIQTHTQPDNQPLIWVTPTTLTNTVYLLTQNVGIAIRG